MSTKQQFISLTKLDGKEIKIKEDNVISYEETEKGTLVTYGLEDSEATLKEVLVREELNIVAAYVEGVLKF